jgi:prepilin-type N-terminal cleavage/methylation domain-containing protein
MNVVVTNSAGPRAGNAAFSLIEVLVAILILGLALAGLTRALSTALTSTKESEVQTTAALLASELVETLRSDGGLMNGETEGSFSGSLALYRWKETLSPSQIDGLHNVKVVIENSRSGETVYELETLLFEPTADTSSKEKNRKSGKKGGTRR